MVQTLHPTGSANYVQVIDLNIEPVVSDEVSRDLIRPYMGNYEVIPANTRVNVTFDVEMAGSGLQVQHLSMVQY